MIINNSNKNDRFFNTIINENNFDTIRYYDILTLYKLYKITYKRTF